MIIYSDKDYIETKRIKKGQKKLTGPFKELAEWINEKYDVSILNVYYEEDEIINRPRINIILEWREDVLKFQKGELGNFDTRKQKDVSEKFIDIITHSKEIELNTDNLLVIFTAFEPIARQEANENIPDKKIKKLMKKLSNKDIWEISRCFERTTFFFYTDKQVEENKLNGTWEHLTEEYLKILKRYDEFDYFQRDNYSVCLDSKENFDKNYNGSWFSYDR